MLGVTFLSTAAAALLALLCSPAFSSAFSIETPAFTQVRTVTVTACARAPLASTDEMLKKLRGFVEQCESVQLSWDSSTGPYNILIANQSDLCGYAV